MPAPDDLPEFMTRQEFLGHFPAGMGARGIADAMAQMVDWALTTCQVCGEPGQTFEGYTLCATHKAKVEAAIHARLADGAIDAHAVEAGETRELPGRRALPPGVIDAHVIDVPAIDTTCTEK